jgi:hypothetical protein
MYSVQHNNCIFNDWLLSQAFRAVVFYLRFTHSLGIQDVLSGGCEICQTFLEDKSSRTEARKYTYFASSVVFINIVRF